MGAVTVSGLKKIAEGREAEMFAWDEGRVLRLLRKPGDTARLEQQAAVLRAVAEYGLRVPAPYETVLVDGRPGLVMERIGGADLLTVIGRQPLKVFRLGAVTGRLHAAMHEVVAPPELPSLKERIERHLRTSPHVPAAVADAALLRLRELPDGDRVCHGDFHPGNVLMDGREPVVIDWTNVTRGDPTADYVRTLVILEIGAASGHQSSDPGSSPIRQGDSDRQIQERVHEGTRRRQHDGGGMASRATGRAVVGWYRGGA